jgi:1-acyl-sn-glycerol-3-phosphate acyltransferase
MYFGFSTSFGIAGFFWKVLWGTPKEVAGPKLRRWWLSHVPWKLGLHMELKGDPYQGTCLYVGNHIAYIDPIVILTHVDANVVAKAEVSKWPLVGYGASIVGTIFVKRDQKSSRLETAIAIREALENNISILVFPEGTTSAGPATLPFRPRSFEAAHLAGMPVQPVAIYYDSPKVAFVGNHTFLPHFFSLFRMKEIHGKVTFGPLLYGTDTCDKAHQWINETMMSEVSTPVGHESPSKA